MYYPIQVPFLLNAEFSESVQYTETVLPAASDWVICFWEMQPKNVVEKLVTNVIVTDACIDLVVDFDQQSIGFSGMSQTNFDFTFSASARSIGARMKPGAFYALTGLSAAQAMDTFLPIDKTRVEFNCEHFFSLSFSQAKQYLQQFFVNLATEKQPDDFMRFFNQLYQYDFWSTADICAHLHYSPRQCQRHFLTHFGLSPKLLLCIVRFQKSLELLISNPKDKHQALANINYYDQSHLIKDFKKNIGLTPKEFLALYQ